MEKADLRKVRRLSETLVELLNDGNRELKADGVDLEEVQDTIHAAVDAARSLTQSVQGTLPHVRLAEREPAAVSA